MVRLVLLVLAVFIHGSFGENATAPIGAPHDGPKPNATVELGGAAPPKSNATLDIVALASKDEKKENATKEEKKDKEKLLISKEKSQSKEEKGQKSKEKSKSKEKDDKRGGEVLTFICHKIPGDVEGGFRCIAEKSPPPPPPPAPVEAKSDLPKIPEPPKNSSAPIAPANASAPINGTRAVF